MHALRILKAGMLTSVQCLLSHRSQFYAYPISGPMDRKSANIANAILSNREEDPLIECTGVAPKIQFLQNCKIAISGADAQWTLEQQKIKIGTIIDVNANQILEGKKMIDGFRSYIAVNGRIHHSVTSYKLVPLKKNDIIEWSPHHKSIPETIINNSKLKKNVITLHRGPEYHWLDEESKHTIDESVFVVSNQTNRMGSRLQGPKISCYPPDLESSAATFPGVIQCTPSGQLIVVLQDGQTTGGYPRIAYIRREELNYFNQLSIGESFSIKMTSTKNS